jgi:hypothetical protein
MSMLFVSAASSWLAAEHDTHLQLSVNLMLNTAKPCIRNVEDTFNKALLNGSGIKQFL